MRLSFFVAGRPVPKGSAKWIAVRGRAVQATDQKLKAWETRVGLFAELAVNARDQDWQRSGLYAGPVAVGLRFFFHRPRAHFRTGRFSAQLRPDAPTHPMGRTVYGDLDKLVRAVLDGLTGSVYEDDTQVIKLRDPERLFVVPDQREGVKVTVGTMEES